MTKYPDTINFTKVTSSCITLCLFVPEDLVYFQGHFPQMSVLPGVVQIDWVIYFACKFFNITLKKSPTIEQVKFVAIIKPAVQLFLTLELVEEVLTFKYFANDNVYSLGRLKL